jgi:divalent metal cation (Fe/Co/Zn/Cd) transporter
MDGLSKEQSSNREKTLLTALLLSAPGPLATGMALVTSHSTTQLADFLRRGVELAAIFISWWVFRRLHRDATMDEARQARLEQAAGLSTAGAMVCSGVVLLVVALSRLSVFEPGGNVILGLTIAVLGLVTNVWFWRRYAMLTREQYSAVIAAQQQLYRAKASVDLCVVAALAAVAIAPAHPATRYVDILGSVTVAVYLLWSGSRTAQKHLVGIKEPDHSSSKTEDTPGPLFRKLDCYSLPVENLDSAIAFYGALGHQLIWREGAHAAGLRLPDSDAEIVLHTDHRPVETYFLVESVPKAIEQIRDAGGRLGIGPFEIPVGLYARLHDPWNNPLVILDFSKGILETDLEGNVIGNRDPD